MRDPARIDRMIDLLRAAWHQSPDLRLGQLIANVVWSRGVGSDDAYWNILQVEDSAVEPLLERLVEGGWMAITHCNKPADPAK